ncbi:hypothetical protein FN846DRAFT_890796 [Sphaerosporella brunnea]|uniref:Uncharacterized protein n=1 Tax=Sphaerosporella brunnea TaxID=1250544 RepID=A0A5J5EVL8_9PEZI|nr:hypothetical protein FN846DRAFT_890796 [Sphaerosporella brunnea]
MDDTTTKTVNIETIPVEIHLGIIAAVLQLEDDYINIAVGTHLRQLRHASPTIFRVWTVHAATLTLRVARERLAALKPYALETRRRQVRAAFRALVRYAALVLAPVLEDPMDEVLHRTRLAKNTGIACADSDIAYYAAAMVHDSIDTLDCLSPGYGPDELAWIGRRSPPPPFAQGITDTYDYHREVQRPQMEENFDSV